MPSAGLPLQQGRCRLAEQLKYYGTLARARLLQAIKALSTGQAKATQSSDGVDPGRLLKATWHITRAPDP